MLTQSPIVLSRAGADFGQAEELLALILRAFAYMEGVIDPPSSACGLTVGGLREKCASEIALIATDGGRLVGCVFLAEKDDHFYLGKLAVAPEQQGRGIGGMLVARAEEMAIAAGKPLLELQARIELAANHAAFARLGFVETARTAHPGFDRPTSITMRKALA